MISGDVADTFNFFFHFYEHHVDLDSVHINKIKKNKTSSTVKFSN